MKNVLTKVRGLLGTGFSWAAVWGLAGGLYGLTLGFVNPTAWRSGTPIFQTALGLAFWGLFAGITFAAILSWTERDRTPGELSLLRVAVLGILGSLVVFGVFPLLFGARPGIEYWLYANAIAVVLGGGSAASTIALARRDPEAPQRRPVAFRATDHGLLSRPPARWSHGPERRAERVERRPSRHEWTS